MTAFEHLLVALSTISQYRLRSFLTLLGVIIGVMAVILLVSLGETAQRYLETSFAELGSNVISVLPGKSGAMGLVPMFGAGSFRKLSTRDAREIQRRAQGVSKVAPQVVGFAPIKFGDRSRNVPIMGVTESFRDVRNLRISAGRFLRPQDQGQNATVCVIGAKIKRELFGSARALHQKVSINRRRSLVVGILEEKGLTLGVDLDDIVYVPLKAAQQMFHGGEDALFQILIQSKGPQETERAVESVRAILIDAHDRVEDFTINDETSIRDSLSRIFSVFNMLLGALASISLLVGGIGIMNTMLISVGERIREVGIRKAVGARQRDIGMQFLVESVTLSCIGGALGVFGGYIGTVAIRLAFPAIPVYCSTWAVPVAFTYCVVMGVFFGMYPALKASAIDPIEALRYE